MSGSSSQSGLERGTGWWGAFVIGLSGVILVTGIAPFAVQSLGAASLPLFVGVTALGVFLCFCLAELAAMLPHRAGGLPSYAAVTYQPLGRRVARHVGGVSAWAYWLGWFPVAPINMILCSSYLVALLGIPSGPMFQPFGSIGAPISLASLSISAGGILVMLVPSWLGIRMGARAATVLGVLAMTPLTLMVFLPLARPSSVHWSNLKSLSLPAGTGNHTATYAAWIFIMIWSVFAMEAAACYIGECRDPHRDAKLALGAEGGFGFFIYAALPLMMVAVLGGASSADPLTVFLQYTERILGSSAWARWAVGLMLVVALLLSVQNAIMGVGRSLYQIAEDGVIPRWFGKLNSHGSPGNAMLFNVGCSLAVLLFGSPLPIYVFSNMGYLLAIVLALGGYFLHRHLRPEVNRPFRLPAAARWVALVVCLALAVILVYGGWQSPTLVVGAKDGKLFFIGLAIIALYLPLNVWRRWRDRGLVGALRPAAEELSALAAANLAVVAPADTAGTVPAPPVAGTVAEAGDGVAL